MEMFIQTLTAEFKQHANSTHAKKQEAYLKNKFKCYGIKTPERRNIQAPFLVKEHLPPKAKLNNYVKALWEKPQREYHYFAQELAYKYIKVLEEEDILLFEYMVEHQSWWDTVDFIAVNLMGNYFKTFPNAIEHYIKKWLSSDNIWLQRSALLFQLKYKKRFNKERLASSIESLIPSNEFFINKAIGWLLREYSRSNPDWVRTYCKVTPLNSLSKREAMRLLK